ncbi:patatin-like phospholipase family protein [Actinomadura sp. WMMB 499]|uniref:patatin-like phospholipase family protein n=1 Tax=Actinomadura sp. WMMB 499 TaxID=1219491 RepID=UPI001248F4E3|nr:patatin-like phospholipase family protein [Actinomadura sp. WMMB 499]QFG20075.1 patatin-like phospholipase family protein [Actinomadura sp. WMMB 499]
MSDNGRALVLGGGGVAGIAWLTGVLAGLAEEGTDVTGAGLLVGTSAGAAVAAQVGSGTPLEELFERQADPRLQNRELVPSGEVGVPEFAEIWARLASEHGDPAELRRAIGARALAAVTVPEDERRAVIADRLPAREWPERRLLVTAVNALTGERRVFDRESGADLVDAVAASCAVPMIWPTVPIGGVRYMDGGVHSAVSLDLAEGCERALVLAPMDDGTLDAQVTGATGRVETVLPDEVSLAAFGVDPLSPSSRTPSAEAGRAQGRAAAPVVEAFWR